MGFSIIPKFENLGFKQEKRLSSHQLKIKQGKNSQLIYAPQLPVSEAVNTCSADWRDVCLVSGGVATGLFVGGTFGVAIAGLALVNTTYKRYSQAVEH